MKKTLKSAAFLLVSVLLISALPAGCRLPFYDGASRSQIFSYVNENQEKLEAFQYEEMPANGRDKTDCLKKALGNSTIVKNVYAYNDNILQFYCGGSGLVTNSTYTGFYYSKDDTPYAMEFDGCDLTETASGVFEWQNEDGSHRFHTEKIKDYWYYYLMVYN